MKNSKKRYLTTSMLTGSMLFSVGCSSEDTINTVEITKQAFSNDIDFTEDKNSIYGEIIEINNENITLALGEFNFKNKDKNLAISEDEISKEETVRDDESTSSINEPFKIITLTGDVRIVTITNDIIISKLNIIQNDSQDSKNKKDSYTNEQLILSDLFIGDIIKVNYNDDYTKIESVELVSSSAEEHYTDTEIDFNDKLGMG